MKTETDGLECGVLLKWPSIAPTVDGAIKSECVITTNISANQKSLLE